MWDSDNSIQLFLDESHPDVSSRWTKHSIHLFQACQRKSSYTDKIVREFIWIQKIRHVSQELLIYPTTSCQIKYSDFNANVAIVPQ